MHTTHGDHIPGTRLGTNPPIQPARCGGVQQCSNCMLEAAAITGLDYYREDKYNEQTISRVLNLLREAGVTDTLAEKAITLMKENGILFRERKKL